MSREDEAVLRAYLYVLLRALQRLAAFPVRSALQSKQLFPLQNEVVFLMQRCLRAENHHQLIGFLALYKETSLIT